MEITHTDKVDFLENWFIEASNSVVASIERDHCFIDHDEIIVDLERSLKMRKKTREYEERLKEQGLESISWYEVLNSKERLKNDLIDDLAMDIEQEIKHAILIAFENYAEDLKTEIYDWTTE